MASPRRTVGTSWVCLVGKLQNREGHPKSQTTRFRFHLFHLHGDIRARSNGTSTGRDCVAEGRQNVFLRVNFDAQAIFDRSKNSPVSSR